MKRLLVILALVAACGPQPSPAPAPTPTITPIITAAPTASPTAAPSGFVRVAGEPDYTMTPGTLNPDVTPATIKSTICVSGWTATVRPPVSYTEPLKIKQIGLYGYADTKVSDYEEDHLIPLELGGNPTSPLNLWPEPHTISYNGKDVGSYIKDGLENQYKLEVCAGTMTLADAQERIGDHWVHWYLGL